MTPRQIFNKVLESTASILAEETLTDNSIIEMRFEACSTCIFRDSEINKCRVCGCYLSVKTPLKTNFNPKHLEFEVTHCPMGKWQDFDTANYYRSQRKQILLT